MCRVFQTKFRVSGLFIIMLKRKFRFGSGAAVSRCKSAGFMMAFACFTSWQNIGNCPSMVVNTGRVKKVSCLQVHC